MQLALSPNRDSYLEKNKLSDREFEAKTLLNIISNFHTEYSDKSCIVAITASLGYGKTFFINIMRELLINEIAINQKKEGIILFNAWLYDFWENPLLAFIDSISPEIILNDALGNKIKRIIKQKYEKLKEKTIQVIPAISAQIMNLASTTCGVANVGQSKLTEAVLSSLIEANKNAYIKRDKYFQKAIDELRDAFESYKESMQLERIYVFIDELDRCKPDFAIRLLETIKHFFEIPKLTFIIAFDKTLVSESLKHAYGVGIDTGGYLRKFFDLAYKLKQPRTIDNFCLSFFSKSNQDFAALIEYYMPAFDLDLRSIIKLNETLKFITAYEKKLFNVSPASYVIEANDRDPINIKAAYIYFLLLRIKAPEEYEKLTNHQSYYADYTIPLEVNEIRSRVRFDTRKVEAIISPYLKKLSRSDEENIKLTLFPKDSLDEKSMNAIFTDNTNADTRIPAYFRYIANSLNQIEYF